MEDLIELWKDTKDKMEDILPPTKPFLERIEIKEKRDGIITLVVPSEFVLTGIKDHKKVLENFLSEKLCEDITIEFIIGKSTQKVASKIKDDNNKNIKKSSKKQNPTLNPKYTLDNFIRGDNSDIAYKAALVIGENPGVNNFNPCLIYGGVGLGKTHLLQGIGNYIYNNHPDMNVIYVTAETFTNEFIATFGERGPNNNFKTKYRTADVLLIDDIHFLQKKTGTQEELFHTFVDLYNNNKQIIFTCDRPITELTDITDRLRTRFSSGLNVDLRPPEYEIRLAIAKQKNKENKLNIPDNVLDYICQAVRTNVRDLEGALITISGIAKLVGTTPTIQMAKEQMKNVIVEPVVLNVDYTINDVFTTASNYFNVSLVDMRGSSRSKGIKEPRQIAIYVAYKYGHFTQSDIGKYLGKDHTSVRYSVNQVDSQLEVDESMRKAIDAIDRMLRKKDV